MFKPSNKKRRKMVTEIVAARTKASLSQVQLSRLVGATDSLVGKIESMQRDVTFLEFEILIKATGEDPLERARRIWTEKSDPPSESE
jgi:hypothetical protein